MNSSNEILLSIPKGAALKSTLEYLDKFVIDLILYLCYGIAILCGFKFIIYIVNGFTTKSYMGPTTLDDTSLFR